jgi:hypothetical protein
VQVALVAPVVQAHEVRLQHTPAHGLGVQVLDRPLYVVPPGQPATLTLVQAQLLLSQQTPGHGDAQVPLQVNVFGAMHEVGAMTEQAPVAALQHLPMQGVGVQVVRPQ